MAEYIDRDAAITEQKRFCGYLDNDMLYRLEIATRRISAADVRPVVRGKWRLGGYGQVLDAAVKWYDQFLQGGFFYCSACKERSAVKTKFCPNCGADMREEN